MRYTKRTETRIVNTIVAIEDMKKKISAFSNDSTLAIYHKDPKYAQVCIRNYRDGLFKITQPTEVEMAELVA